MPYIFWNIFICIVIFLRTEIHIQRQVIKVYTHNSVALDADFRIRICVSVCIYRSAIVNVGRHFASFSSHLLPCRFWCAIQVMRTGRNRLYSLSHLTAPLPSLFRVPSSFLCLDYIRNKIFPLWYNHKTQNFQKSKPFVFKIFGIH